MFNYKLSIIFSQVKNYFHFSLHKKGFKLGFTIIEILIVITIVSILATISVISYVGISQRAVISSIQNDLSTAAEQLKTTRIINGAYPGSITDCPTPATGNSCLKLSGGNTFADYSYDNGASHRGFCINVKNGTTSYKITSMKYTTPIIGDCAPILVPSTPIAFNYTGGAQSSTVPVGSTSVLIETWGAQGYYQSGLGGYSKGNLAIASGNKLGVYVGGAGGSGYGGFNGGGADPYFGGGGGGASDVRYDGTTTAATALAARKIVAGGGGGGLSTDGYGGGSTGGTGNSYIPCGSGTGLGGAGGTQTTGFALGVGGTTTMPNATNEENAGGSGGGGYYGGFGGGTCFDGVPGGGGGSGYIGGVTSGSTIAGNLSFPTPTTGNETGHAGNGAIKLTYMVLQVEY